MINIDEVDRKIITQLKKNAKLSIQEIADKIGLSKTPVYNRIKKLESSGIIKKYAAIIDNKALINGMFVFCFVTLEAQKLKEIEIFKDEVRKLPEVLECYLMGGSYDFLLKVLVNDLSHYHFFSSEKLAVLNNISQIKSTFVLETIKKED